MVFFYFVVQQCHQCLMTVTVIVSTVLILHSCQQVIIAKLHISVSVSLSSLSCIRKTFVWFILRAVIRAALAAFLSCPLVLLFYMFILCDVGKTNDDDDDDLWHDSSYDLCYYRSLIGRSFRWNQCLILAYSRRESPPGNSKFLLKSASVNFQLRLEIKE